MPVVVDVAKAAKDFFPNFKIAMINTHLRLTRNVSDEVQRLALESNPGVPNNVLMSNSTQPSNIAEGHPLVNIQGKVFIPTLEECLSLTKGLKTMIVVDRDFDKTYKELRRFVIETLDLSQDEQAIDDSLIFIGNFHLLKKYIESFGKKAFFLTGERDYRCTETETCQWFCEQTDCVLITTPQYIKGFECEAIIDFTNQNIQEPEVLSRATIRVIKASVMMNKMIEFDDLTKMIGKYS